jgi:hypothetical protein
MVQPSIVDFGPDSKMRGQIVRFELRSANTMKAEAPANR